MSGAEIVGKVAAGTSFQIASGQIVTAFDTSTTLGGGSSTNSSLPTQLAVQTYVVDSIRAIDWKESVTRASTAALTANYVGSPTFTLTNSGALVALQLDGATVTATKRVLIKNQGTGSQNGIYTVTTVGDGATAWVLTRAFDFDSSAEISAGAATYVESGTANGGLHYVMSNASFVAIDVQDITWTRMGGASTASFPIYTLTSESFENPVTADWNVNSLAVAEADSVNSGLTVRRFLYNGGTFPISGAGFVRQVPTSAVNISARIVGRSVTTPGASPRSVGLRFDYRVIPNSSSALAWSSGATFDAVIAANDTRFHSTTVTKTLVAAGLTAGNFYQFEVVRVAPGAGTGLVPDFLLLVLEISFT